MFSTEDLIQQYEKLTDEELFSNYKQLHTLSDNGQAALKNVIDKKGGIERLEEDITQQFIFNREKERIISETKESARSGFDIDFIKKSTTSSILDAETTHAVIADAFSETEAEKRDLQISPKTIAGSVIGAALATIIGGVISGLWFIETHTFFYISVVPMAFLAYILINRMTKQSKNNRAVFVATGISTLLAIALGWYILQLFG